MIAVEAATARALAQPTVTARPRLRWALQGGLIDLSDRIIEGTLPRVRHQLGAYLSGERYPSVTFELQNADNLLTPDTVAGSLLAAKQPQLYMLDSLTYDVEVLRADGTWEAIPVFTGVVEDLLLDPGQVTITAAPIFSYANGAELPYEYIFGNRDFLSAPQNWFANVLSFSTWHQSSTNAIALLKSLDWNLYGTVRKGTTVGAAALLVAKSCLGTWWTTEDGMLAFATEFPGISGDYGYFPSFVSDPIRERDGSDWRLSRPLDLAAREVVVQYQGVSVSWRSTAHEGNIGRLTRTVTAPYMAFSRQAMLAARILFEQYGNYPHTLAWTMGIRGLRIQLNDRVTIEDPWTNTPRVWRIVSKDVADMGMVRFEAVLDGHHDTVIANTTFAKWDSTTWAASGAEFL